MRYLHLMREEKFLNRIREFYDRYYNGGDHEIGLVNFKNGKSLKDDSLSIKQYDLYFGKNKIKNYYKILNLAKQYDYLVFHSFQFINAISEFLWIAPSWFKNKVVWIEWGADLYKNYKGIPRIVIDRFKSTIAYFVAIFPPDIEEYKRRFPKSKAKTFYAPYCGPTISYCFLTTPKGSQLDRKKKGGSSIVIQIGQNASPTLHHIEVIDILSKFSHENIELLLPLSYGGDKKYADSVQEHVANVFGNRVHVLRELLPAKEYFKIITNDVDIAIFQTWRQAALSNIGKLLWNNVKVYLPGDSVMYRYFHDNGVPVYKTEDIQLQSFEQFIAPPVIEDIAKNQVFWDQMLSMEWKVNCWNEIYNSLPRPQTDQQ